MLIGQFVKCTAKINVGNTINIGTNVVTTNIGEVLSQLNSNNTYMSNQIGTTPIPPELGTTITGAINNLYSSSGTADWTYVGSYSVTASEGWGSSIQFNYADYSEILIMLKQRSGSNAWEYSVSSIYPTSIISIGESYYAMTIFTWGEVGIVYARVRINSASTASIGCCMRHSGYTGEALLYAR